MLKTLSLAFLIIVLVLIPAGTVHAAPGDLDMTFGIGGRITTPGISASSVLIQPDGKIVTAGGLDYGSIVLARYTPDGVLDPTFDGDGMVFATAPGFQCTIALAPNGKIVVAVSDKSGRVSPPITFVLLRFNSNGSPDTTFDGDGIITPSFTGFPNASSYNLVVQPDGKIIAVGFVRHFGRYYSAVARFNDDGSIDTSFSGDGLAVGPSFENFNSAVTIQPDGKILAAGSASLGINESRFGVSRYNVDGSADTSFNSGGYATADLAGHANDVVIQPDGKIVIAGSSFGYDFGSGFGLARFNNNGSLDNSFDYDGKVTTPFGGYEHEANAVAIQPDGKIVAGGSHRLFDKETWEWHYFGIDLARYNNDGSLDTSFSGDGRVGNSLGAGHYAADFAIRSDGKIVAAGFQLGAGLLLARYRVNSNAPVDFDADGRSDVSVFRPSDGIWYLSRSTEGFTAIRFGLSTDTITPADYDGDGKTDIAIFRDGTWWLLKTSNNAVDAVPFGVAGDIPVPADYTGDGRDELAVYRAGQWWLLDLSTGGASLVNFGLATDKPVPGDYDGDGKADVAIFRPGSGEWWLNRSTLGVTALQFGNSADKPVQGDYTGDGKSDVALWRPSTGEWFVLRSENSSFYSFPFGASGDIPAPGDYDGDGRYDATVFRPSSATWFSNRTTAGTLIQQFGATGDRPVPNAFVP